MIDYFKQLIMDFGDKSPEDKPENKDATTMTKKTPVFISMSGKKQVGKDTAVAFAKKMLEKSGKTVAVTAFAEPLKRIAIDILGISESLVYGSNEHKETLTHIMWDTFPDKIRSKYGKRFCMGMSSSLIKSSGQMTVREVLQVLGTDIFRQMFENDVWANAPFRRDWSGYDVVFLTDCRFPNEKRMTEENGGVIIRLARDTGFVDNHLSETALDDMEFDVTYNNDGTLEELQSFTRETLKTIGLIDGE